MKMNYPIICCTLLLFAIGGINMNSAQQEQNRPTREFMREKLSLAQQILEGLTTENYDIIVKKAKKLSAMSNGSNWRVFENPDYDEHSLTFRRHADALIRTAREKNLDAATLAYVRVVMSCVDCHQLVRGKLIGDASGRVPLTLARLIP